MNTAVSAKGKAIQANHTDLKAVRDHVKRKMIEWAKDGLDQREIAIEYADLQNDLMYVVMINEEISYKFDAVMKTLPSVQDLETLQVIHTKAMKHATDEETAEAEKAEVEKLAVLIEAIQKFNK